MVCCWVFQIIIYLFITSPALRGAKEAPWRVSLSSPRRGGKAEGDRVSMAAAAVSPAAGRERAGAAAAPRGPRLAAGRENVRETEGR